MRMADLAPTGNVFLYTFLQKVASKQTDANNKAVKHQSNKEATNQ